MIWFTSDHHFGHKNIIKYTNRPFNDVKEMDEELIKRWNERVQPDDEVYHLGDLGLGWPKELKKLLKRLNGKIYLILGNHDSAALKCADRFEWIKDYHELEVEDADAPGGKQLMVLFHYAMRVWHNSHRGAFHLYGHSHGSLEDLTDWRSFDVGVDSHNFYPINYEDVKAIMMKKNWKPPFGDRREDV